MKITNWSGWTYAKRGAFIGAITGFCLSILWIFLGSSLGLNVDIDLGIVYVPFIFFPLVVLVFVLVFAGLGLFIGWSIARKQVLKGELYGIIFGLLFFLLQLALYFLLPDSDIRSTLFGSSRGAAVDDLSLAALIIVVSGIIIGALGAKAIDWFGSVKKGIAFLLLILIALFATAYYWPQVEDMIEHGQCAWHGGAWRVTGDASNLRCVIEYSDAGKTCTSSSQCLGDCVTNKISQLGREGVCETSNGSPESCFNRVESTEFYCVLDDTIISCASIYGDYFSEQSSSQCDQLKGKLFFE